MGACYFNSRFVYNQDYQVDQLGNGSSGNILRLLAFTLQLYLMQSH